MRLDAAELAEQLLVIHNELADYAAAMRDAGQLLLEKEELYRGVSRALAAREAEVTLGDALDAKNAEGRKAQLTELTGDQRLSVDMAWASRERARLEYDYLKDERRGLEERAEILRVLLLSLSPSR